MNDITSTLITFFASIPLVCAVIVFILYLRGIRFDKQVNQCVEMQRAIAIGITHEELLKMKMPRKLRAKVKQSHNILETLAEIREFIEEIEGSEEYQN